jgi:hypothetical protein
MWSEDKISDQRSGPWIMSSCYAEAQLDLSVYCCTSGYLINDIETPPILFRGRRLFTITPADWQRDTRYLVSSLGLDKLR